MATSRQFQSPGQFLERVVTTTTDIDSMGRSVRPRLPNIPVQRGEPVVTNAPNAIGDEFANVETGVGRVHLEIAPQRTMTRDWAARVTAVYRQREKCPTGWSNNNTLPHSDPWFLCVVSA